MLKAHNISKTFRHPPCLLPLHPFSPSTAMVKALDHVSFTVEAGTKLAVLGANGAGKTTLLKTIATLITPDLGSIALSGCNDDIGIKRSVSFIGDPERSFYWRLTGRQNLEFFAALYDMPLRAARARIADLLNLFKVDYADRRFETYSSGMKKTFSLIRGLIHTPRLLLLDEPTKSLDHASASRFRDLLNGALARGQCAGIVFATHDLSEAVYCADTYLLLDHGRPVASGKIRDLRDAANGAHSALSDLLISAAGGKHDE